jgi:hypothetical protein
MRYVLDESLDQNNITAFTHCTLTLYANRTELSEIIDRPRIGTTYFNGGTGALSNELDLYAHAIATDLPNNTRRALFAAALVRYPMRINEMATFLCGSWFEDEMFGGCFDHLKKKPVITKDMHLLPKTNRKLHSPAAIRKYCYHKYEGINFERVLADRLCKLPWPQDPSEADELNEYFEQQAVLFQAARRAAMAQLMESGEPEKKRSKVEKRRIQKDRRKVLVRSAALAAETVGRDSVAAIAQGRPLVLEGQTLNYHILPELLQRSGHGALTIKLVSKNYQALAGLCLYFDNTPALDQLTALKLFIESGSEEDLIKTGNLYNVTSLGAGHPMLAPKLEAVVDRTILPNGEYRHAGFYRDHHKALFAQRRREYTKETLPHYKEALIARIWGSSQGPYKRFATAPLHRFAATVQ